ncbi:VOC family protein [Novosphingobium mathurense]|uniref:Catechol-2,3-dioxygenase n=1 Tax=Novosphingobium mathurense TaxID=428990 RepID=A0A1U6IIT9_9SPHN|nr:VOC family protein [Novosphingobium mathurense]SLK07929.1 Catechol-2,3-dioxygenase [Novosphingobium mathurense]
MALTSAQDLAYVVFSAPDLERMRAFLLEFGLREAEGGDADSLYMTGWGKAPFLHKTIRGEQAGFAAVGFDVGSLEALERLAIADGLPVEDLAGPGGGKVVHLTDPDGFAVDAVAGRAPQEDVLPGGRNWNQYGRVTRMGRKDAELSTGPSHVMRLGHLVLSVAHAPTSEAWYQERFGLLVSDAIELDDGHYLGSFMRCDRGDEPADHHSLFLAQNGSDPAYRHAAFEVLDMDDLLVGHDYLEEAGATKSWGVGRHLLGGQVFDYWRDPFGHVLEHWTDGDLLVSSDQARRYGMKELHSRLWGTEFPGSL